MYKLLSIFKWLIPSGDLRRTRQLNQLKTFVIVIGVTILVGFEAYIIVVYGNNLGIFKQGPNADKQTVCIVDVNKPITPKYARQLINHMEKIRMNPDIYKHVIIEFNSPGGNPAASEEIAYYLEDFQKDINTTFYVASSAASGAYMAACVADSTLYSAPSAVVGSIGVYVDVWSAEGFFKNHGIKNFSDKFASHPDKVPFSLAKDPDERGITYIKDNLVMPIYKNFYNFVKTQRDLNDTVLEKHAKGRIFIASEVKGVLVDEIATHHQMRQKIIDGLGGDRKKVEFLTTDPSKQKSNVFSDFDIDLNVNLPIGNSIQ